MRVTMISPSSCCTWRKRSMRLRSTSLVALSLLGSIWASARSPTPCTQSARWWSRVFHTANGAGPGKHRSPQATSWSQPSPSASLITASKAAAWPWMSEMHKNRMPHGSYGQAGSGTRGYAPGAGPAAEIHPKTTVTLAQELENLALVIAPERARMLLPEQSGREGGALGVLLGSAFPALTPSAGFQHDALDLIAREGFRARRRARELFPGLRTAIKPPDDP